MRSTLLFVLILLGVNGFCSTPIDTLKVKISQIEKVDQKRIDSLQRELQYYKVRDDFYSDKFSALGSLYSTVMAIIAGFIAAIGITVVFRRIEDVKKELSSKMSEIAAKNEENESTIATSYSHFIIYQASVSRDKARDYIVKKEYTSCIIEAMRSIKLYCTAYSLGKEIEVESIMLVTKEFIDHEVIGLIHRADAASINLLDRAQKEDKLFLAYRKSYASNLLDIVNDSELDDLVATHTSSKARQLFYKFKLGLDPLINELNKMP